MKYIRIAIAGLLLGLFACHQAYAQLGQNDWIASPLYIEEANRTPYRWVGCRNESVGMIMDTGNEATLGELQGCVVQGDALSFLHKSIYLGDDQWFSGVTAIKLPNEQNYVNLIDTGEHIEYSTYATESDTLVEVLVRDDTTVLRITPNASDALVPGRIDAVYGIISYGFDYSKSQEYTFLPSQLFGINNGTISADGRYVYVDLAEKSIDDTGSTSFKQIVTHKIDTKKRVLEAFVLPNAPMGNGILAVSPSGQYVVSGRSIVDTKNCHYSSEVDHRVCSARSYAGALDKVTGYDKVIVNNDENFVSVWFSDGETNITLEPLSPLDNWEPSGKFYRISLIPQLEYLALGDSYSSGEGDLGRQANGLSYYINDTDGDEGCHLSSRSYPFLLGKALGDSGMFTKSVACSGARVRPDFYGDSKYDGQFKIQRRYSADDPADVRRTVLQEFTPGEIRQLEFVKEYRPIMITFTGGGNDVGFVDILEYCAQSYRLFNVIPTPETCAYVHDEGLRKSLNATIDTQYVFNKKFIEEVKRVSPETEIYVVGYPQFVKIGGTRCLPTSPILNSLENIFIRDSVTRLNNVLKRVARDTDTYYVDIEDSLEGGQICQGSKYMTGPVRTIVNEGKVKRNQNMYHPNAAGHQKMAERIAKQIKEKPGYVIADIPTEESAARVVRTAVLPSYAGVGSTHTVQVGPGTIKPDGTMSGDAYSSKVHLGDYVADATGALTMSITIPPELGIGKHLFTFTGLDINDQPVQLQQFVYVTGNDPNDIDGDGIPNEDDPCFAITEWYENGVDICASQQPTLFNGGAGNHKVVKKDALTDSVVTNTRLSVGDGVPTASELTPSNANTFLDTDVAATKANPGKATNYWPMVLLMFIITAGIGLVVYGKRKLK